MRLVLRTLGIMLLMTAAWLGVTLGSHGWQMKHVAAADSRAIRQEQASDDRTAIDPEAASIRDRFNTAIHDTTTMNPVAGSKRWFCELARDLSTLDEFRAGEREIRCCYSWIEIRLDSVLVARGHTSLALRTGKRLLKFFPLPQRIKDSTAVWVPRSLAADGIEKWTDGNVALGIRDVLDDAGLDYAAIGTTSQAVQKKYQAERPGSTRRNPDADKRRSDW